MKKNENAETGEINNEVENDEILENVDRWKSKLVDESELAWMIDKWEKAGIFYLLSSSSKVSIPLAASEMSSWMSFIAFE